MKLLFISKNLYPRGAADFVTFVEDEDEAGRIIDAKASSSDYPDFEGSTAQIVEINDPDPTYKIVSECEINWDGERTPWAVPNDR